MVIRKDMGDRAERKKRERKSFRSAGFLRERGKRERESCCEGRERRLTVTAATGYAQGWWGKRKRETPGRKEMKRWKGC